MVKPSETTRVLLVDDDALVRAGLRMILSSSEEVEVVGEAADGADACATRVGLEGLRNVVH